MIAAYILFQIYTYIVVGRIAEKHDYEKIEAIKLFALASIPGVNVCFIAAYFLQL